MAVLRRSEHSGLTVPYQALVRSISKGGCVEVFLELVKLVAALAIIVAVVHYLLTVGLPPRQSIHQPCF